MWKGVISFGMVSIPVKLFTATESKDISFHLLHEPCKSRLKQLRWCPVHEEEVPWGEIVKGYEFAKDQHVVLADDDFDKLPLASKDTIELSAFVKAQEIDPIFYEKSYYLEPEKTGAKPYALLLRALQEKKLTAVAKIAIRNKERLCALRPQDGTLVLETLFYADEIRAHEQPEAPRAQVSEQELKMAYTLIDVLEEEFDPTKYQDEYRDALSKVIEAKLEGEEIVAAPAAPTAKVTDLMSALKASVEAAKQRKEEAPSAARRRKATAA
jgi:DNA end-binding protein Ku